MIQLSFSEPLGEAHTKIRPEQWEKAAFTLLALWCLLPLGIAVCSLILGMTDESVLTAESNTNLAFFSRMLSVYKSVFRKLGVVTIAFVLTRILFLRDRLTVPNAKARPWLCLFAGMLYWATLSALNGDNPAQHIWGSSYRCDGLSSYLIYAAVFCCALFLRDESRKHLLLHLFSAAANPLCAVMLLKAAEVYPFHKCFLSYHASVFNQFNHFAYYLSMSILCLFGLFLYSERLGERIWLLFSFAFQVYTLLINGTLGGWLAVAVGLCAALLFRQVSGRRFHLIHLLPVALFLLLSFLSYQGLFSLRAYGSLGSDLDTLFNDAATLDDEAGSGRWKLWMSALKLVPQRPLLGFGPEGLTGEYMTLLGNDRPHNELIQHMVFLGIPGLCFYLSALMTLAVDRWRRLRELSPMTLAAAGGMIAYLSSSLFGNTMFNTAPYFWLLLGLTACLPTEEAERSAPHTERLAKPIKAGLAAALALVALLSISAFRRHFERAYERCDLSGLELAYALGNLGAVQGLSGEFWLDADSFALVPTSKCGPIPFGRGSPYVGRAERNQF